MSTSSEQICPSSSLSRPQHPDACAAIPEKTILLMGAGFSTPNMGVWALASGTIEAALHTYPDARIVLFDYGKEPKTYKFRHADKEKTVELLNIRFSRRFYLKNNIARMLLVAVLLRLLPRGPMRSRWLARNPWLKAVDEADVIAAISGGDSFSDIYGLGRLIYVSLPQLLPLVLGRKLILLPQTLGPFRGRLARALAKYVMERAALIYARDNESFADVGLVAGSNPSKFLQAYDMAFALTPSIPANLPTKSLKERDIDAPIVGLNVSGLLYKEGHASRNVFGLRSNYRHVIEALIHYFIRQKAQILLIPHVYGSGPQSQSDLSALAEIHREFSSSSEERLHLVEGAYDHRELKYLIGKCDFFVGSRMHACIAALSQSVPAIGLAYSRKFQGVFASVGAEELVIDLTSQDEAGLLERVGQIFESRAAIREQLTKKMPGVRGSARGLFSQARSILREEPGDGRHRVREELGC